MTTAEALHAKALELLTDAFTRTHEDPAADAARFLRLLTASGWRPVPSLADRPALERRASKEVAAKWSRQIRQEQGWPEPKTDGAV